LTDIFYSFFTSRIGEGHVSTGDTGGRPGQGKQAILDRLGWFSELGVTWSGLPVPAVDTIEEYYDYAQWVAEEIIPVI
jgi:hypothetical protein